MCERRNIRAGGVIIGVYAISVHVRKSRTILRGRLRIDSHNNFTRIRLGNDIRGVVSGCRLTSIAS